jgi:hypothetical protein
MESTSGADPSCPARKPEVVRIPVPIMFEITSAVALPIPSWRRRVAALGLTEYWPSFSAGERREEQSAEPGGGGVHRYVCIGWAGRRHRSSFFRRIFPDIDVRGDGEKDPGYRDGSEMGRTPGHWRGKRNHNRDNSTPKLSLTLVLSDRPSRPIRCREISCTTSGWWGAGFRGNQHPRRR